MNLNVKRKTGKFNVRFFSTPKFALIDNYCWELNALNVGIFFHNYLADDSSIWSESFKTFVSKKVTQEKSTKL